MASLVWTRGVDDWERDEALLAPLAARGVEILRIPCIATQALGATPRAAHYDHVILTSRTAVDCMVRDPALLATLMSAGAVHTHGGKTAERLRAVGRSVLLHDKARSAEDLSFIVLSLVKRGETVLVPTASRPAFDIAEELHERGITTESLAVYETIAAARRSDGSEWTPQEVSQLVARLSGVICFASPSAVKGFAAIFAPATNRLKTALTAAAIGPTTEKAAKAVFDRVVVADRNDVSALAEAASSLLKKDRV